MEHRSKLKSQHLHVTEIFPYLRSKSVSQQRLLHIICSLSQVQCILLLLHNINISMTTCANDSTHLIQSIAVTMVKSVYLDGIREVPKGWYMEGGGASLGLNSQLSMLHKYTHNTHTHTHTHTHTYAHIHVFCCVHERRS